MAISKSIGYQESDARGLLQQIRRRQVEEMCHAIDQFFIWEREHVLLKDPSPAEREEHQRALKWLLRITHYLVSATSDPDYSDPSLREMLEGQLWRLEQSWKMLNNPMSEAEAEQLLSEVFPDEPRA